jgi:hypothetical protein
VNHTSLIQGIPNDSVTEKNALAGGYNGAKFKIFRKASGAFVLDVGGLKLLDENQWCEVEHDGIGWLLTSSGFL